MHQEYLFISGCREPDVEKGFVFGFVDMGGSQSLLLTLEVLAIESQALLFIKEFLYSPNADFSECRLLLLLIDQVLGLGVVWLLVRLDFNSLHNKILDYYWVYSNNKFNQGVRALEHTLIYE